MLSPALHRGKMVVKFGIRVRTVPSSLLPSKGPAKNRLELMTCFPVPLNSLLPDDSTTIGADPNVSPPPTKV